MIEEHPDTPYERKPSGQLALPPAPEAIAIEDMETRRETAQPAFVPPASAAYHSTHRSAPLTSARPMARMAYFWKADPAYKVLIIAIAMVLVAATIFITLLANTFAAMMSHAHLQPTVIAQNVPTPAPTSVGADGAQPTFPPPGKGAAQSSQLPTATVPATVPPPPSATTPSGSYSAPPPSNSGAAFAIWITSIPAQVSNTSDVTVTVTTTQPGLAVHLMVSYDVSPYFFYSQEQTTDRSGNASLTWSVQLHFSSNGNTTATAHVLAIAHDQKGNEARSQTVIVHITNNGSDPDSGLL